MHGGKRCVWLPLAALVLAPVGARAQHEGHEAAAAEHGMLAAELGAGWSLLGMGQAIPIVTAIRGLAGGHPLRGEGVYLTQPALMLNLEGPASRVVLRATLNFEGVTQEDGEPTPGAWGEGFLDRRHPHTLVHELMLSLNLPGVASGVSVSAGKGFAPFGTDDPMARPAVKYPTNHHLSQILERWTVNGVVLLARGWSVEAGVFGGTEPEGPYDFSNVESFGDSWSARVAKRWGGGGPTNAEWEASLSHGDVADHEGRTRLWNAALRRSRPGGWYALAEASRSDDGDERFFSALGEARLEIGEHRPHARLEYATRPEFVREGADGAAFFRYDHDAEPVGATRWLIATAGWGWRRPVGRVSIRPLVEVQYQAVRSERGGIDPRQLFGTRSFWAFTAGARIYLGGDPARMGSYGVLDAMTAMHRP